MMSPELYEDLVLIGDEFEKLGFVGKTIMITGATGFLGSLFLKSASLYNKNHEIQIHILALARNPAKAEALYGSGLCGVEFFFQDICDPVPDIACDYIIHTASSTISKTFMINPVEVINDIYTGARNILTYAKTHDISGIVYLSSMEVFGAVESKNRSSEKELGYIDLQNVRSCYSEAKRLAECLCHAYAHEYGVHVRVARLAQTFGAGLLPTDQRAFAQFARSAVNGENIVLHTNGESYGNYVYTRDAVKAILLLLKKGEDGEAYTVANENSSMMIKDMAEIVLQHFGAEYARVLFDIPKENLYGYAPETKLRLSAQKMKELGWSPEVSLVESYRRMISSL